MFDDLRQQASNDSAFDEEPLDDSGPKPALTALSGFTMNMPERAAARRAKSDLIFGLNGPQRFVLSLLFLLMVVTLGAMVLLVSGKVILPL